MSNITCVTGYWCIKNKHKNNNFLDWFNRTLKINNPYIVFSNKEGIELIKKYRKELPTYYIELNIEDFYMQKYKDKMIIHNIHSPTKELNMIWNEKIFLLQKAKYVNPFNSDYFYWIDAALCVFRNKEPPSNTFNINSINKLPKDKIIFSTCGISYYNEKLVQKTNYYHYISGTYIIHKNILDNSVELYNKYLDELLDENNIWTDQVIWTHIYKDNKNLFYKLCEGFGNIVHRLY